VGEEGVRRREQMFKERKHVLFPLVVFYFDSMHTEMEMNGSGNG